MTDIKVNTFGFVELDISANTRRVKTSVLFENPHRGYKSNPKWDYWIKNVKLMNYDYGTYIKFGIENLVISKGDKLLSCNFSIDRTITNSGDSIVGWRIHGFVRFTIDFEGKTFKRWTMVHSEYGDDSTVTYTWADPVQSALCTEITSGVHHKMHLIAPRANGNPGADLVPRPTNKLISLPLQKASFNHKSRMLSRHQVRREVAGMIFKKISPPVNTTGGETGNLSKLMVPGFDKPVFNIKSTTTFRIDKDDSKIFTMSPGRWMDETNHGNTAPEYTRFEIHDISFGAAHRASVSVASTPKKQASQKKRYNNKNVFRRL